MKSYQQHLTDTKSFGENQNLKRRPIMRSSAIFPLIFRKEKINSIYTFMGYWLRKRNIPLVTVLFTLRDKGGDKINIKSIVVDLYKSYSFLGSDFFDSSVSEFDGSIEIEIFSAVDMVFPYPAITFALKSINGLTFVHTCGRIYNDFDDLKSNNQILVPETGFDLLIDKNFEPFFSFINGPIKIDSEKYELIFIDDYGDKLSVKKEIKNIPSYGLVWEKILDEKIRSLKLKSKKISVKIKHNFQGFFPRFVAGNVFKNFSDVSLTHSYYDSSADKRQTSVYTNPSTQEYYDSVISLPYYKDFKDIELAIYPNMSKSLCKLSFDLFNFDGSLLKTLENEFVIADGKDTLTYVSLMRLFKDLKSSLSMGMVRVRVNGNGSVPTRMKFGLNIFNGNSNVSLPSNVCFNANVPNSNFLKKPGTFKWCPIFDVKFQKIFLHNTSFVKRGFGGSELKIEVCRDIDSKKLSWSSEIPENGTIEILNKKTKEIENFLNKKIGWVAVESSNPFVNGYYITDYNKGVIGADHLY